MPKVTLIQVVWHSRRFIEPVYTSVFNQTYKDFEMVAVIAANDDNAKELIAEKFPQVKIIDPGYNIGFARGHNEYFEQSDSEFFQLVNPDLILSPTYLAEMLKAFEDPRVGAATGKLLRYDFESNQPLNIIDTTGVVFSRSGRGRDRGQHEEDKGQYDNQTNLIAVSGAGPMYRKSALEAVKTINAEGRSEYFDEDFHSYWEDVDLGMRMVNAGYKCVYVPRAVAWHGRAAGSSKGGYKNVFKFIKFHSKINPWVRELNYRNHIFLFLKNSPRFYLTFFFREFFMLGYIVLFETSTLKTIPKMLRLLPTMWQKRKAIQRSRKISASEFEKMLN